MSLIFFDLDGTLTDPAEGITKCIKHALEAEGAPIPSQATLESFIGPPLDQTFEALLGSDRVTIDRAIAKYRERFATVGLFENRPYDGIKECLAKLREDGFRLAVATSKPHVFSTRIVEKFELDGYFEAHFGSELDGTRTNKRELLGFALEQLKLSPHDCLMVGDRKHDILGAQAHKMKTIAVSWGFGSEEEHQQAGADARALSVSQLGDLCLNALRPS